MTHQQWHDTVAIFAVFGLPMVAAVLVAVAFGMFDGSRIAIWGLGLVAVGIYCAVGYLLNS
ncbi:hypothetical protein [Rhizobium sp. RAF56]|uniref:hypothetical protein n=1 Tax=Rhizobium sp. RAF56 TaxID=3233062 RepID=UPI003F9D84E0